jgi:hypothetical protein
MVNATLQPLYPQERGLVPIVQEDRWDPEPVRTGAGNLAPTGIRSPDCPAPKESLDRLSYPDTHNNNNNNNNNNGERNVQKEAEKKLKIQQFRYRDTTNMELEM